MQELLKMSDKDAKPTQQTGKVNIDAAREALAIMMDALRAMQEAGVKVSQAKLYEDGRICALPMIEIPEHKIGISVMEVMERGKTVKKHVFTTDGVSVMDAIPPENLVMEGHKESTGDSIGHGRSETSGHGSPETTES